MLNREVKLMETLTLEITNLATVQAIEDAAKRQGVSTEALAIDLLETAVLAQRPFEEVVEPIAQSFDRSGMSEEELDDLIEQTKNTVRESRRK